MVKKSNISQRLYLYRFEVLLISLLCLLFDKIFFAGTEVYMSVVWPVNMIVLGLASVGIFKEKVAIVKWIKNSLFLLSIFIPLAFSFIVRSEVLTELSFGVYFIYYSIIFVEVLRQITQRSETTISVIYGSISGFLLLIVISQFVFLTIEYNHPHSFTGLTDGSIPSVYSQLSYFSMVTLCTIGYGDITPVTEISRLTTMFFAIVGQFYLIALVGIIISRFNQNK